MGILSWMPNSAEKIAGNLHVFLSEVLAEPAWLTHILIQLSLNTIQMGKEAIVFSQFL